MSAANCERDSRSDRFLSRGDLERLHREGLLDSERFAEALILWDDTRRWQSTTARWCAVLGVTFLLSGILFFFAYNWKELSRLARFAILEAGILLAVTGALLGGNRFRGDSDSGRRAASGSDLGTSAWLSAAAVLTGILIAVYGQAYQTGADAWQNFMAWALLILPWVWVSRFAPLWLLFLGVLHLGFALLWDQDVALISGVSHGWLFLLLGSLDAAAFCGREVLARRAAFSWLAHRSLRYLTLSATLTWLGAATMRVVFHEEWQDGLSVADWVGSALFVIALVGIFRWFRRRDYDLGSLLIGALFGATALVLGFGRVLFEDRSDTAASWLLMMLVVLSAYGGAAWLLQRIHRCHAGV